MLFCYPCPRPELAMGAPRQKVCVFCPPCLRPVSPHQKKGDPFEVPLLLSLQRIHQLKKLLVARPFHYVHARHTPTGL